MAIRFGVVVATHPEDYSVDVIMTDDYSRLVAVQVLCSSCNDATGANDLYAPQERSGQDKWDLTQATTDNPVAAIDFSGVMPVVVGFRYPQIGQMTFKEKNLSVQRHMSDVYSTLNAAGEFEVSFPNGTFIRIAATPDHVDLSGTDVDGKWAISKNQAAATHLRLVLGNAGVVKADLHIDPSGNVTGTFQGTGDLTFIGDVVVNAPNVTVNTHTATVNASTKVELATPLVHCTQALTVDGPITGAAGLTITGATALQGVTSNGVNVGSTHVHGGVQSGSSNSAVPH